MRRTRTAVLLTAVLLTALAVAGCGASPAAARRSAPPTPPTPPITSPVIASPTTSAPAHTTTAPATHTATTPSPPATSSPPAPPPFRASTSAVTAAELGASWHPGCPVGPDQLRQLALTYWGFDGQAHAGLLVVNAAVAPSVIKAFSALYDQRFPIRRMQPVADFGGSDDASMAADNTSGFNCRNAVAAGPPRWSAHAYGEAIDVNTVENPYLDGGKVLPPAGAAYEKRSPYRPGMAVPGGVLVKAFAAVGWSWGGRWSDPDYQHFSSTGG